MKNRKYLSTTNEYRTHTNMVIQVVANIIDNHKGTYLPNDFEEKIIVLNKIKNNLIF